MLNTVIYPHDPFGTKFTEFIHQKKNNNKNFFKKSKVAETFESKNEIFAWLPTHLGKEGPEEKCWKT